MNNKDREALDKFVDEDSLSPEDTKRFAEMLSKIASVIINYNEAHCVIGDEVSE